MKTSFTKVSVALALMALSGAAMAGIAQTRHNMGSSTNGAGPNGANKGWNFTSATTEICVFCHTPHGGDNAVAAPLWNRTITTTGYTSYAALGTTTMDSKSADIGSVSLACLSCHDGTQALNSQMNTPGSNTTGTLAVGTALGGGTLPNTGGFWEFTFMSEVGGEPINLGTDLSNDHPVSIQYAGAVDGRGAVDADFVAASSIANATGTTWYIETTGSANPLSKDKNDLPLYKRDGAGTLAGEPLVECATCHDPHTSVSTTFLRNVAGNVGSATCLSCHVK